MTKDDIISHFGKYIFKDPLGHDLLMCADFRALVNAVLICHHQEWVKLSPSDQSTWPTSSDTYCTYVPSSVSESFNGVSILFLDSDSDGDESDLIWIADGGANFEFSSVTHWMPLPLPPIGIAL